MIAEGNELECKENGRYCSVLSSQRARARVAARVGATCASKRLEEW